MSKNTFSPKGQRYEAPQAEIIAIESQSVFCTSGNNPTPGAPGAGINGMNAGASHGW